LKTLAKPLLCSATSLFPISFHPKPAAPAPPRPRPADTHGERLETSRLPDRRQRPTPRLLTSGRLP
uniref:Uncharacterized protein n=1 Tax=Aegilops tauschii subsp. strangulata TaxID=200361 RepID=A0A453DWU6_AEGTS